VKILRVIYSANPQLGGVIEAVRLQQAELENSGFEVQIVSCDTPGAPWLDGSLPVLPLGPSKMSYGYTSELLPWLKKNHTYYDAVIVDGLWQYHSFAVWRALAESKTPYFVIPHGMLGPWFKRTYPLKHLKKWLYWPWAEYRVLRDAQRVVFTCEEERLRAKESFSLYKAHATTAALGVSEPPENRIELRAKFLNMYPHLRGKRIILFLGRIHEVKGVDLLINAFARRDNMDENVHLVIAGPGSEGLLSKLKQAASRMGVENQITWTGMLTGDLKWGAFYASEVFCLPSHHENFGMVVVEAMACSKPVLISNQVNIWQEIETGGGGFVAEDSLAGTSQNLEKWLSLGEIERKALGDRARKCFEERFDIKKTINKLGRIVRGDE